MDLPGGPRPLPEVLAERGAEILGREHLARRGPHLGFLGKILDTHPDPARGMSSAQVHAAPGQGRPAKPEFWVGLTPGTRIRLGFARDLGDDEFRRACADGSLEGLLQEVRLGRGGAALVRGGMPHCLGGGAAVLEIALARSAADPAEDRRRTVAFYDRWGGRAPRPGKQEVEEALALIGGAGFRRRVQLSDYQIPEEVLAAGPGGRRVRLCALPGLIWAERLEAAGTLALDGPPGASLLFVLQGGLEVAAGGAAEPLGAGEYALVPAAAGPLVLRARGGPALAYRWGAGAART